MEREALNLALEELAVRFSEGWHESIKIDASDIVLLSEAAQALAQQRQETVARVLQIIKELRPAIKPLEVMGKGKTTDEWFDILVKEIEQAFKEKNT